MVVFHKKVRVIPPSLRHQRRLQCVRTPSTTWLLQSHVIQSLLLDVWEALLKQMDFTGKRWPIRLACVQSRPRAKSSHGKESVDAGQPPRREREIQGRSNLFNRAHEQMLPGVAFIPKMCPSALPTAGIHFAQPHVQGANKNPSKTPKSIVIECFVQLQRPPKKVDTEDP